jgi:hypothetical protein
MPLRFEPFACDLGSEVFVFLIALGESCIMEEAGELQILEVLTIDSLGKCEIRRTIEDSLGVLRIVIGIVFAVFEKCTRICFC